MKGEPSGADRGATMSRAAKGGRPDGGRNSRNRLLVRGCRCREGPGEQVDGGKTASAGRAVEAVGVEACLDRLSKTGTRVENRVQRAVQLSLRVAYGRDGFITRRVKGGGSIKQSTMGQGFKIRR